MNIPKRVGIIVKGAENLEYAVPGSKKSSKSRKWRVVFVGGSEKLATEYVDEQNGCPNWDCEVTLDLLSPKEPVSMLVLDGESRHIGQVNVPLTQIPQNGPPNFDMSRLFYSELEPTRKNSNPRGRLLYWIWAVDYWPPGTSVSNIHRPKSLRGSLSHLRIKSKHKPHESDLKVSNYLSENPYSSALGVPGASYNPLEDDGASSEYNRRTSDIDAVSVSRGLPPMYQSTMNIAYAQSEYGSTSGNSGKHKNLLKRFKHKVSKSTHNLTESAARKAAGKDPYFHRPESQLSVNQNSYKGSLSQLDISSSKPKTNSSRGLPNQLGLTTHSPDAFIAQDVTGYKLRTSGGSFADEQSIIAPSQPRTDGVGQVAAHESPGSTRGSMWGLHAEERPNKPFEEMSKREASEYVQLLEKRLQGARTEIVRLQMEQERLSGQNLEAEEELNEVRLALATLRNRLLEDNLTQYLELSGANSSAFINSAPYLNPASSTRSNFFDTPAPENDNPTSEPTSFLAKLTALGMNTRKIGGIQTNTNNTPPANVTSALSSGWW